MIRNSFQTVMNEGKKPKNILSDIMLDIPILRLASLLTVNFIFAYLRLVETYGD